MKTDLQKLAPYVEAKERLATLYDEVTTAIDDYYGNEADSIIEFSGLEMCYLNIDGALDKLITNTINWQQVSYLEKCR